MNVGSSVLSSLQQHKIILTDNKREIDLEGFDVDANNKTTFFMAGILPQGLNKKKADEDGSTGTDDNNLYVCGRIDVQLDDKLEFCEQKAKVLEAVYWREGNFTHIIARTVTRKEVTYA